MLFRIILWIFGWRLRWLSRHNEEFKGLLAGKDVVIQLRTMCGRVSRHYFIKDQEVHAKGGRHHGPSLCIAFLDAAYAVATIKASSRNQTVFMQAVQEKNIKVTGDMTLMLWLISLMRFLPRQRKQKKR